MSWIIDFSPSAVLPGASADLTLTVQGTSIFINGSELDLSFMEEGDRIDREAISGEGAELIRGPISLVDGVFRLKLLLPYDPKTATQAHYFPEPVTVTEDGPVTLPGAAP